MIVLNPNPTFTAPVEITLPATGTKGVAQFTFRTRGFKQLRALLVLTQLTSAPFPVRWWHYAALCWRAKTIANAIDMLDELIDCWSGFDVPYSKRALMLLLLESPSAMMDILNAYFEHREQARIKN